MSGEHRDRLGGRVRDPSPNRPRRVPRRLAAGKDVPAPRRVRESESYQGRRRWPEPTRRRLLAGGLVLAVGLLVLAGLTFRLPGEDRRPDDAPGPDAVAAPGDPILPTPTQLTPGDSTGPSGVPSGLPSGAPMGPAPGVSSGPSVLGPPVQQDSQTPGTGPLVPPPGPPFTPIQIEAEDARNSVTGAAQRVSYGTASGGVLVRDIGSPPGGGIGTLTIPVSVPDAGQYNLLIRIAVPDGPATLTVVVTVSGSVPVAVPVTGRALCCSNGSATVGLQAGANWITFGNPTDRGPAIDFVQITRSGK